MGRINFREYEPGIFRKIACGTWRTAGDPSVYALLEIEMSKALEFAEAYSQQHGVRITPTHLAAKAITHCLEVRPELNGLLRRGRVYLRRNVSIFFQVNVPGQAVNGNRDEWIAKAVLSGTTVQETDRKSLAEIAQEIRELVVFARQNILRDPPFTKVNLISCRNLLIYLRAESQKKVMALLHFALQPGGYLLLGTSDTIGSAS